METKMQQDNDSVFDVGNRHKPCRACTDFKTWTKNQKENFNRGKQESESVTEKDRKNSGKVLTKECPLNREELGRNSWSFLHTMAAYYPEQPTPVQQKDMNTFLSLFSQFYPCEDCAKDFQQSIKETPPDTQSQSSLSQWMCRMHNLVNQKLGKPEFDCNLVDQRWKDGWKDGSCD